MIRESLGKCQFDIVFPIERKRADANLDEANRI